MQAIMARIIIPLIALVVLAHSYILPGRPTDQRAGAQTTTRAPTYPETQPGNVTGGEEPEEYRLENSGKYCCSYRPAQINTTEPRQVIGTETYVLTWTVQVGEQICEPREYLWYTAWWKICPIFEQRSSINTRTVMTTIYETTITTEACRDEAIICCSPLLSFVPRWGGQPLCVDQGTYDRISGMMG